VSKRKVNWFRIAVMFALAALVVAVSLILGKSPIGYALGQTVPPAEVRFPKPITLQDRDTYSMTLDQTHQVCWSNANTLDATNIKIWRYRVEGGARTLYLDLARAGWVAQGSIPNSFCKTGISIPKAGHWIYDAALCVSDSCSDVVTASCGAGITGCAGAVGGVQRGWWIYAYLPAPTGPVVD
jgi:hypothetical protein